MINEICITANTPCQLNCESCGEYNNKFEEPTFTQFKKILDVIPTKQFDLDLTPLHGDFFSHDDWVKKLILSSIKFKQVKVVTHALHLSKSAINKLKYIRNLLIEVSYYGTNEVDYDKYTRTKGNYNLFISNYKHLIDSGCNISTQIRNSKCDVSKINYKQLIYTLYNCNRGMTYSGKIRTSICDQTKTAIGIFPNGDVTMCDCWDFNKEMIIGNIFKESILSIITGNNRMNKLNESPMSGKCRYCNAK